MKQEKNRRENDRMKYNALLENCTDMSEHIQDLQDDLAQSHDELRYLQAFICYKKLEAEYLDFREHAHEVYEEDLPFPIITL